MEDRKIVAIGLLTKSNLDMLGSSLERVIPVAEDDDRFRDLLKALDEAERTRSIE